jgi:hypothetical protein
MHVTAPAPCEAKLQNRVLADRLPPDGSRSIPRQHFAGIPGPEPGGRPGSGPAAGLVRTDSTACGASLPVRSRSVRLGLGPRGMLVRLAIAYGPPGSGPVTF